MRKMHQLVEKCVDSLVNELEKRSKDPNNDIDVQHLMKNYTIDVIICCAFATKIDPHNDPNNPFVTNAHKLFSPRNLWRLLLLFMAPHLIRYFNISVTNPDVANFYKMAVRKF